MGFGMALARISAPCHHRHHQNPSKPLDRERLAVVGVMLKLNRLAVIGGRAIARHRLLPESLYSSAAVSAEQRWPNFGRPIRSFPHGVSGTAFFSVGAQSVSQDSLSRCRPSPARFAPKDVLLYQYEACPFCNKVKAFLDYYQIPYKIVEVNPINKKEIKWSDYKKVPILIVDGEEMVDSSDIINRLFEKIRVDKPDSLANNDEAKKWCGWVDNKLVHVLSPNIYRTTSEAVESFDYITNKGNFGLFERTFAKYAGAAAMYLVSKKLKKRHNITDERAALYDAAETWIDALNGRQYLGGSEPNLADLAVFGVLRPIRNLRSGRDMVENTRIGDWYNRMESVVGNSSSVIKA